MKQAWNSASDTKGSSTEGSVTKASVPLQHHHLRLVHVIEEFSQVPEQLQVQLRGNVHNIITFTSEDCRQKGKAEEQDSEILNLIRTYF